MATTTSDTSFGEMVRASRLRHGITQTMLADAVGLQQPAISAWESGISVPTVATLLAAGKVLKWDDDELVKALQLCNERRTA